MIIIKSKGKILKNDKTIEGEDLQIAGQEDEMPLIQYVTETRIRKYKDQKHDKFDSREIKKWFEARRV